VHLESHAGLGWLVGVAAPHADRRLRNWCLFASVLPDLDAITYLWGPVAYGRYHHTFGHNVFLGAVVTASAAWHHRDRPGGRRVLAAALVAFCFAAHLLADMKLSAYPVHLFWPLSWRGYEFETNLGLAAPINTWLVYASLLSIPLLAWWRGVTPLDGFSPRLDGLVMRAFRSRTLACATCGTRCAHACDRCRRATCLRHGRVVWGFRLVCPACSGSSGTGHGPAS
jgi:hypothetical protein